MTSIEIAELVNSHHDSVKRIIEALAEKSIIRILETALYETIDNLGLPQKTVVYLFTGEQGKCDSVLVVAQLNPEFTARLVDRWEKLELNQ